ncbi:MAG: DUF126 domain-containing protein [Butyricicoccus sp.]|nr:DUF126 domain-containing protein [Butyricicoccus sp.]
MEKVIMKAKYAVRGSVRAPLLWADAPLCFWGVVDPQSGLIRDNRHPLYGQNMSGKTLAFTCPKGSSGTGLVLMEQVRNHCAPAAIINITTDPVVLTGPLIEANFYGYTIPVVTLHADDYAKLANAQEVEFYADRDEIAVYY